MKPTVTIADVDELDEFPGFDFASQAAARWETAEREQPLERFGDSCEPLFDRRRDRLGVLRRVRNLTRASERDRGANSREADA